jgi:hypothetical protein
MVDMVVRAVDDVIAKLEPPMPAEDLLDLMLQAWGDEQAMDVLVDAGLERGAIKPPRRHVGRRADTRTDAEKAADERADLRRKAAEWARPFVETLFRRHWSTKPAFPDSARLPGTFSVTSVDQYNAPITFSQTFDAWHFDPGDRNDP